MRRRRAICVLGSAAIFGCLDHALAQTINWNLAVASGNWNNSANWNPMQIPLSGVSAALTQSDANNRQVNFISTTSTSLNFLNIDATGTGRMTLTQSQDVLGAATLSLGTGTTAFGILNLSGGTLNALAQIVGSFGNGTITHTDGTNLSSGFLSLGDNASGTGTYLLSSSGAINVPEIFVGYSGKGMLNQSGGQIVGGANSFITLANNSGSYGTLQTSAGTISVDTMLVGEAGSGTLVQNGSVIQAATLVSVGDASGGKGTYNFMSGSLTSGELDVGFSGSGKFVQIGGIANINGPLMVAANSNSRGTFTISTGSFTASTTTIGPTGTINFNGGALALGSLTVNNGKVNLSVGGNKLLVTNSITLTGAGAIDLNDNDMIIRGGNSTADIKSKILAARNGGFWNGIGITSSAAGSLTLHNTMLGVLQGSEYRALGAGHDFFDGALVSNSDVLVKYTYYGDTDFNGRIDSADYAKIDTAFAKEHTAGNVGGWSNGDSDFNGRIDTADYSLIDISFGSQTGTLARALAYLDGGDPSIHGMDAPSLQMVALHFQEFGSGYASTFLQNVPEPAGFVSLGSLASIFLRKRRRKCFNDK